MAKDIVTFPGSNSSVILVFEPKRLSASKGTLCRGVLNIRGWYKFAIFNRS